MKACDEHIVAITAKIKRDPKNASLYLQRGELYRLHRNWTRAAADYDRASRLQPTLTIVDLARGQMLFESGRFQRAKLVLDRFLRQQPRHVEGLVTRGRVLAKLGSASRSSARFHSSHHTMRNRQSPNFILKARKFSLETNVTLKKHCADLMKASSSLGHWLRWN